MRCVSFSSRCLRKLGLLSYDTVWRYPYLLSPIRSGTMNPRWRDMLARTDTGHCLSSIQELAPSLAWLRCDTSFWLTDKPKKWAPVNRWYADFCWKDESHTGSKCSIDLFWSLRSLVGVGSNYTGILNAVAASLRRDFQSFTGWILNMITVPWFQGTRRLTLSLPLLFGIECWEESLISLPTISTGNTNCD